MCCLKIKMCNVLTSLVIVLASVSLCTSCEAGQVEDSGFLGLGIFAGCEDCEAGTYQSGSECLECRPGTYTDQVKEVECRPCPSGRLARDTGSTSCELCEAGQYSGPAATGCVRCPPGMYSGASGSSSCVPCPGGRYSADFGSSECVMCEDGMTSPSGSTDPANCTGSCSGGFIHTVLNETVLCQECESGMFSTPGALECTECPAGTSSVPASASCTPCGPGTFANTTGSKSCVTCAPGTVNNGSDNSICLPCPNNTYSNSNNTTCLKCPLEAFSKPGSVHCLTCDSGFFLNSLQQKCQKCPGNWSSKAASYSVDHCYRPQLELSPSDEPGTELAETVKLSYRQIAGIVFAGVGLSTILGVLLYAGCWGRRRHNFNRSLVFRSASGGGEPVQELENLSFREKCTVDYSSCTEETPTTVDQEPEYNTQYSPPDHSEPDHSEHVYDTPVIR